MCSRPSVPGKDLDEGAEIREAHDFAEIGFADFGGGGDVADHLQRGFGGGAVGGEDVHLAVVHRRRSSRRWLR